MAKGRSSKSSSTPKRTRRKKSIKSVNSRIVLIVLVFLVLVGFSIYGLNNLKDKVTSPDRSLLNRELSSKIEEVNNDLYKIFFKLGISSENIKKDTVTNKKENGLVWQLNTKNVLLNSSYSRSLIFDAFKELDSKEGVEVAVSSGKGIYTSEVSIDGFKTHVIKFKKPQIKKKSKTKTAKLRTETKKGSISTIKKSNRAAVKNVYDPSKPSISIIIDDIGLNKHSVDNLLYISDYVTFAILPGRPYSSYAAEKANEYGIEILLHQPMEPKTSSGYTADDAGEGVLLVGQTKDQIIRTLERNLYSLPNAVGVNNHMGSKFSENEELMLLIMNNLKRKNLFYLDSLTTENSFGYSTAKSIGVNAAKRDIFLDDKTKGKSYVKKQLQKLVRKAKRNGWAVGICHPYPNTIEVLTEELPKINDEVNIRPVTLFNK